MVSLLWKQQQKLFFSKKTQSLEIFKDEENNKIMQKSYRKPYRKSLPEAIRLILISSTVRWILVVWISI